MVATMVTAQSIAPKAQLLPRCGPQGLGLLQDLYHTGWVVTLSRRVLLGPKAALTCKPASCLARRYTRARSGFFLGLQPHRVLASLDNQTRNKVHTLLLETSNRCGLRYVSFKRGSLASKMNASCLGATCWDICDQVSFQRGVEGSGDTGREANLHWPYQVLDIVPDDSVDLCWTAQQPVATWSYLNF